MTAPRVALFLLFVLIVTSVVFAASEEENRLPHVPIAISSEDDLSMDNGVVSGTGVAGDPYVVSGWEITVQSGIGIRIQDVSIHVLVKDCRIIGSRRHGIGILLRKARNVRVVDCIFTDLQSGVFIYQNAGAHVEGNSCSNCTRGIEGTESNDIRILRNKVDGAVEHGIFLWRCHDAVVANNSVADGRNGVYLDSCHRDRLDSNRIKNMAHGMFLWDCFDCSITKNTIQDCELGLAIVHTSEGNSIFHNAFLDNNRSATCDEVRNSWDGGYPAGGNYWGEPPVVDCCSGEDQDRVGPDGICDTPREIPFGNMDRYPLVHQPVANEEN